MFRNSLKIVMVFILGAIWGSIGDYYHSVTATAGYHNPDFLGLAWWVPLLFGSATILITFALLSTDHFFRKKERKPSLGKVLLGLVAFEGLYLLSGYLPGPSQTKVLILYVLAVIFVVILDTSVYAFVLSLIIAGCGTFAESTIVSMGNFYYSHPNWNGVPYWLPSLYMVASVAIGNMARYLFNEKRIYVSSHL